MEKATDLSPYTGLSWQALLDASQVGLFLLDRQYNIVWANEYARRVRYDACMNPDIIPGTHFPDILPKARREPVQEVLKEAFNGVQKEYEVCYHRHTPNETWLQVHYAPIAGANGEVEFICMTVLDISVRKQKEMELALLEQRWKFALEGAGNGVWEYNFQTGEIYYSAYYKKMLGYTEEEFPDKANEWQQRIHPEDAKRVADIDRRYIEKEIENHSIEYRLKHKDGHFIWVLDRGMLLETTSTGKPGRLIGTNKDITARKAAEEELQRSEHRFASFMDNSPTMTWIMDEQHIFHYMNRPYMDAFNLSEEAIGKSMYEVFPKEVCDAFAANNRAVWEKGATLETIEEGRGPNGEVQYYQIYKFPLPGDYSIKMIGGVALDITAKLESEKVLTVERERNKQKLIQGIIDAQEKERDELAYELHENVNQILSSAKMMLEVAAGDPALSQEFVHRSLPFISEAISELRKISQGLRPSTLRDISLEAAISEVVFTINSKKKVQVKNFQKGLALTRHLHPDLKLVVLRAIQELLSNVSRHAEAKEAELNIDASGEILHFSVRDNGKGFDPKNVAKGVGLSNIINRIEYHGGSVVIEATQEGGSLVSITLPLLTAG